MKKTFNVTVATNYIVEAEDENAALEKAENMLAEDVEDMSYGITEMFGFNVEEQ